MKFVDLFEIGRIHLQESKMFGALLILSCVGMGCSKPTFSYDARPGSAVEHFRNVALDPREDFILGVANMHRVDAPVILGQVVAALEAKGYRFVPADQAELWLDVFTLAKGGSRHGNSNETGKPEGRSGAGGGRSSRGSRGSGMEGGRAGRGGGERNPQEGGESSSRDLSAPGGDLMIVVELVERRNTEMVWTGVLELPMPKAAPKAQASTKGMIEAEVKHLLEPLPMRMNDATEH